VEAGLLDEEKARERDDAARQPEMPGARQHAGRDDDERGHLGGAVDVAPARAHVGRDDERARRGDDDRRERLGAGRPEPARDACEAAEQRERPHAGEVRAGAGRMAGPLALHADRGAAQGRGEHAERRLDLGGHGRGRYFAWIEAR
jgi:hypothetical protein